MSKKNRTVEDLDAPVAAAGSKDAFSRPFAIDRLHADGAADVTITADAQERAALAQLDGLEALERLEARFHVARQGAGARVTGEIEADVVQTCVLTLEPFAAVVREPVDVQYVPADEVAKLEAAAAHTSGEPLEHVADVPDPIVDGRIDLGVLAAEFLALGLDPYPRKPGVAFEPEKGGVHEAKAEEDNVSPFAALRARQPRS